MAQYRKPVHGHSFPQNLVNEYLGEAVNGSRRRKSGNKKTAKERIMQRLRLIIAAAGLALLMPLGSLAQAPDAPEDMTPEQRRAYMQGLTEPERQALREQKRAQWEAMSDEERRLARRQKSEQRDKKRAAMREHWQSLSEEEREAARQQHREQAEKYRDTWNNMTDEQKSAARQHMRGGNRDKQRKHHDAKPRQQ
jgi:hypothetical protein